MVKLLSTTLENKDMDNLDEEGEKENEDGALITSSHLHSQLEMKKSKRKLN